GKDPLADEPPLAPRQPARLRARDRRFRAAHARRPRAQLRGGARAEAVQGPLRSGAMRRAGAVAVLVGLSVAVSAAPPPEDVVRAKLTAGGGQAAVEAIIAPGWHVNAHQPRDEFLIPTTVAPAPLGAAEPPAAGQDQVASWIARWGWPLTFLWVALVGVALNWTPCVYPLISVTVAFFGGRTGAGEAHTVRRALLYVLGICLTF